ncbi:MAG: cytochrome c [Myxococcales bacterium]|nr:cytochrome c [Myxococcales bacterium]
MTAIAHHCSNRTLRSALLFSFALAVPAAAAAEDKGDGKQVFQDQKCTKCHSAPGVKGGKKDLAGVGKRHDGAWIEGYLQKKKELDGKKHKKKFGGSDAELKAVAAWLASLK